MTIANPESQPERSIHWTMWYGLILLTMINVFAQMDRVALAVLLQPIKAELLLSDAQLGLLTGPAFVLFYATLGLPLARLADRANRTRLLSICLLFWSLMTTFSGFARNFPQLFLARAGVGVGEAGCLPASYSLISDTFPRSRRTFVIAIFQCGGTIGISVGTFIVGMLTYHFGWRTCLQLVGLAGVPLSLLVFLTLREPPRPPSANSSTESTATVFRALARRPAFIHLTVAYALHSIATSGMGQWNPSYLMRSFHLSMSDVGVWAGLATAAGSILGLLTGGLVATWLSRRDTRWEVWIPAIATLIAIPFGLLLTLGPVVWIALTGKIVMSAASSVSAGVSIAAVQAFVEPHRRATAVSVVIFLNSVLGLGFGPYYIGAISDLLMPTLGQESLRYGMLASIIFLPWSALHYLLASRRSVRDSVD